MTDEDPDQVSASRYQPRLCATPTTMSLEAARNISIPELLHALNEKLYSECNRLREYRPPPAVSISSLETEVSIFQPSHLNHRGR